MKRKFIFLVLLVMPFLFVLMSSQASVAAQKDLVLARSDVDTGVRLAAQDAQASAAADDYTAQMDLMYPDDIDPPESCHVPQLAPLGQDIEMMLGPWGEGNPLLALAQPSSWNDEVNLDSVQASTNLSMATLTTEDLVAVWADSNQRVKYATWGAISGWSVGSQLGVDSTDGNPVIISRGPRHWAVFARFGSKIKTIEWYMGSLGTTWWELPGVADAASDPVVISQDAGHMAVFYRTASGEVKFTEWEGSWYQVPISLGQPSEGKANFPIVSELSGISRNDTHAAVFGVDSNGQLWFRERTSLHALDWSDTAWVKMLEGVEASKPAVTSRNANHIGVVVKGSDGQPYYTRWMRLPPLPLYLPLVGRASAEGLLGSLEEAASLENAQASPVVVVTPPGWSVPVPLGDAAFTSPMTLVQRSRDALAVYGIAADQRLYEIVWTEDDGWGSWQDIGGGSLETDQVLAGASRRMNDVMLLGRNSDNQVWSKNFTSLDKLVTDEALSAGLEGLPRGQVLALVEGKWVWVSVTRESGSGTWQVKARSLHSGVTASLDLAHENSGQVENRLAVAAADLDVDGNTEVVVATLQSNQSTIDLSVLELSFLDPATLVINASPLYEWTDPSNGEDVNVAIGDLDGDQEQDEVVVGYRYGSTSMRFGIFQYTEYGLTPQGGTTEINYLDHCLGVPGCTVGQHDLEIATGRVFYEFVSPHERQQLVVLDVSAVSLPGVTYAQDWVLTLRLDVENGDLEQVIEGGGCKYLNPSTRPGNNSSTAADPYMAGLSLGDMDASGIGDIAYSFGNRLAIITDTFDCGYQVLSDLPDQPRSLVVGDFDTDGRGEAALAYRSSTTTMEMIEMVEGNMLRTSAQRLVMGGYTLLAADTDNDTFLAELAGCKTFADIQVVAVVNGAPRWYADGQPIQNSRGLYGCTEEGGGGSVEDGTTTAQGVSLTFGFEFEVDIPGGNIHDLGFRTSASGEYMSSTGTKIQKVSSKTAESGYDYDAPTLGMVVYNSTEFTCYYYNIYPPTSPESITRGMLCTPTGRANAEDFKPLEDWHSANFKQAAGPSWADVGHISPSGVHTNDLDEPDNYPYMLPEIEVVYAWGETPIKVSYSSMGGFYNYWHLSDMTGLMTETINTSSWSGTASLGGIAFGVSADVAYTHAHTSEDSNTTSWAETLEVGGGVEKFQDDDRLCYDIIPYIHRTKTRTDAGVVYPYIEMDFYLPSLPYPCAKEAEIIGAAFGLDEIFPYKADGWRGYFALP